MKDLTEADIQDIIERVRLRLQEAGNGRPGLAVQSAEQVEAAAEADYRDGIFQTIDEAVAAAKQSYEAYSAMGLDRRRAIIDAVRESMLAHGEQLAQMAHQETGLGRWEDKVMKNRLVTTKTPGPEDLQTTTVTGDQGMMVTEWAPFGIIAAITPTTNPTSTVINNAISTLSAGNAVVFNVHPNAKATSAENVRMLNRAISGAQGPPNLVTATPNPTIESAQELMHHPDVNVLLVTGGPGVVREALKTDKRAITAGPGNPPVVVDETAEIPKAAWDVILGASFDNNIVCTDEKEVFVVESVADRFLGEMATSGAYLLKEHELRRLERVIFSEMGEPGRPGVINTSWIGKNAGVILSQIGINVGDEVRLAAADVPREHPLVWTEQMMPVLPVVRVPNAETAMELSVRAEHGFRHTASIHSTNVERITRMARMMNCSIFVANGSNFSGLGEGGEGFTSYSIASPTGDGLTRPRTFSRERRIAVVGALRIV